LPQLDFDIPVNRVDIFSDPRLVVVIKNVIQSRNIINPADSRLHDGWILDLRIGAVRWQWH
jgi:hypothetical protein